jgi:hypothetical protein
MLGRPGAEVGHQVADQPAPYPLLVTVGTTDVGDLWLVNYEELGNVAITGTPRTATT